MKPRIFYTKPSITEKEIEYATDAARNGWGDRCYEYITRFEEQFRKHLGVKYAIATSSCTGAMHMGLAALGVGSGDEVILGDTVSFDGLGAALTPQTTVAGAAYTFAALQIVPFIFHRYDSTTPGNVFLRRLEVGQLAAVGAQASARGGF